MKATDLPRASALTAELEGLEHQLRSVNLATFDVMTWHNGESEPVWVSAYSVYPLNHAEMQTAAREIVLAIMRRSIDKVKAELQSIGVVFDDPKQLPAPVKEAA